LHLFNRVVNKVIPALDVSLTLEPLFHPQFECSRKMSKNWVSFHEIGYQFRRFAGSYCDKAFILWRVWAAINQGMGNANPKLGMKLVPGPPLARKLVWSLVFSLLHCFHPGFPFPSTPSLRCFANNSPLGFYEFHPVLTKTVYSLLCTQTFYTHIQGQPTKHIKCRPMLEERRIPEVIENQILKQWHSMMLRA